MKDDRLSFTGRNREALGSRAAKVGGYSFVISVIFLAILVAVNVAVSLLPSKFTQFDISAQQLYSVTTSTKAVVQNLNKDVTVYWITQNGEEDAYIEKLLNVYDGLSSRLSVVKKNPDIYPTFAAQYTDETVANNSLVIECGEKYRYIAYADIYEADYTNYYTTGSASYYFDGESLITSAIDYAVSDDLPQIYVLTGHDEADLGTTMAETIEKANFETQELTLLNIEEIPEDCDAILINAPASDISADEAEMLEEYVENGGMLLVISGLQEEDELTNLNTLLTNQGITKAEGIVIETDSSARIARYPYMLLPTIADTDIGGEIAENNKYIVLPIVQGLDTSEVSSDVTLTTLLSSTDTAFSKIAGYDITTYDKEDGDIDGPFDFAISLEYENDGRMVWISCNDITNEDINSYSAGANVDFVMNALSWLAGEEDAISIRSKSLDYSYLTISDDAASRIKFILIGLIPIIYLVFGLDEVIRRRKRA